MALPIRDSQIEALYEPHAVRAFTCQVDAALIDELRAEEVAPIGAMVAARKAEFATARACARAALGELGVDAAIPRRDGGSPQWPVGMAGSISHTRGYCVAVASADGPAIGIDVEEIARMKTSVERRILVDEERSRLARLDPEQRRTAVAAIFAAKEAFYKAHYEIDARYLGFDAVSVTVEGPQVSFAASSGAVEADLLGRTNGRLIVDQGRVTVGVVIATSSP